MYGVVIFRTPDSVKGLNWWGMIWDGVTVGRRRGGGGVVLGLGNSELSLLGMSLFHPENVSVVPNSARMVVGGVDVQLLFFFIQYFCLSLRGARCSVAGRL